MSVSTPFENALRLIDLDQQGQPCDAADGPLPQLIRVLVLAAAATGVAGMFPASLGSLTAQGTAMKAAQLVLPAATNDVTPFKIQVPQEALDDLHASLGTYVSATFPRFGNIQIVELPEGASVEDIRASFENSGLVDYAEFDIIFVNYRPW